MRVICVKNGTILGLFCENSSTLKEDAESRNSGAVCYQTVITSLPPGKLYDAVTDSLYDDPAYIQPELPPAVPVEPPATWDISKNAFKKRFPRSKWNAASMASASNSLLYDFFETYREVPYVTLTDAETHYAVMALSMDNIPEEMRLTGDEVDAVLSVPARSDELP